MASSERKLSDDMRTVLVASALTDVRRTIDEDASKLDDALVLVF
jgi:hypothetical protein